MEKYNLQINRNAHKNPCYNCGQRKVGCHGKCELYMKFKNHNDEDKEKIKENKKSEYMSPWLRRKIFCYAT